MNIDVVFACLLGRDLSCLFWNVTAATTAGKAHAVLTAVGVVDGLGLQQEVIALVLEEEEEGEVGRRRCSRPWHSDRACRG